ncbi:MAG: hypothetical protein JO029_11690 [Candidatus Eremiobacteraeota bacterium]|nr:hypothetical protein [Candidatus Eremiobacteraeota bacterium]MBV8331839.1 hypothetical protein [Candidatus Eremiobacteraeota bacterium]MBV8434931.1 hypothetical protein [Candidatus Eremiobacteraeota bacterium]MBV8655909.1 hypothetical protein [Candidatus Eremiobacteraeota bacterium]
MNEQLEQLPLSAELLTVMRNAGRHAQQLREPFITARSLLLSLLDDETIGPVLAEVVPREKLLELPPVDDARSTAARLPETGLPSGEKPPMPRYDTLAFKLPDSTASVWLSHEGFAIFTEGANRAEGSYLPKHLAFGLAAEALRAPGVLAALRIEPGKVTDALFALE